MQNRVSSNSSPRNISKKTVISLGILLLGASMAAANPTNGSFEAGQVGWTVTGNAEAQAVGSLYTSTQGTWLMTFNSGQTTPNGVVSQAISTLPGGTYRVDFDYGTLAFNQNLQKIEAAAHGPAELAKTLFQINGLGGGATKWAAGSISFTATNSTTTISFTDKSGTVTDSIDLTLDNVRVTMTQAPLNPQDIVELDFRVQGVATATLGFSVPTLGGATTMAAPGKAAFAKGTAVQITAPANENGASFLGWMENTADLSTNPGVSLTANQPTVLTAAYTPAVSSAQVQLAWNTNPESNITGYWVYHRTGSQTFQNCPKTWVAAPTTTLTLTGLTRGQTYDFACQAQNANNQTSGLSPALTRTIPTENSPQGRIVILESEQGAITEPYMLRNEGGIGWVEASQSLGGAITHAFTNPQKGSYYVWVRSAPSLYQEDEACEITLAGQTHRFTPQATQPGWGWRRLTTAGGTPARIHLEHPNQTLTIRQIGGTESLPANQTQIQNVSSEETAGANNPATNALDGNPATIWHTRWDDTSFPPPHQITLNLTGTRSVAGIQYTPRQDGTNGHITGYKVLTSTNGTTWVEQTEGIWPPTAVTKSAGFAPVSAAYIRLTTTDPNDRWASAAELRAVVTTPGSNAGPKLDKILLTTEETLVPDETLQPGTIIILEQPTSKTVQPGETLHLTCKAVSTEPIRFQWVKNNQTLPTAVGNPLSFAGFTAEDAGTYKVQLATDYDTAESQTAALGLPTMGKAIEKASVAMATDGTPQLRLDDALPGTLVNILASSNLADWERIQTHIANGEPITITDPHPGPKRFYSAEYQK